MNGLGRLLAPALLLAGGLAACDQVVTYATRPATIRVEGMTCAGCESTICTALKQVEGVTSCNASHTEQKVDVVYQPAKTDEARIAAAIRAAGYQVPNTP